MPATPAPPLAVRAINALGAVGQRLGVAPSLDADGLIRTARRRTGLDDLGPDGYREGLEVLAGSLDGEARLHTIGRLAARTRLLALLEVRLRLLEHRRRHPGVRDERIERPIFVLGLPRTGTTVLYGLLAANPAMRSPVSWEVARPFPPPDGREDDPRIVQTEREFDRFRRVAPNIDRIHPLGANLPQECLALQAPAFASYEFPTTFPVPSYWAWLRTHDLRDAYRFERWFLQHLQSGYGGQHWILKTPAHLMWLDTLLDEFPDALLVHTHRDPATVLASVSSLMFALRSAVSDHVDPHEVGRDQLDAWTWGLERTLRVRDRIAADRVVDVHFRDTVERPVETVRRIQDELGLEVTDATEAGVRAYLADNPRDKHGRHEYTLEDFGIHPGEADERFAAYRERFGLGPGSDGGSEGGSGRGS